MTNKTIGLAITGSFCTFEKLLPELEKLAKHNTIIPIFSYSVAKVDTRFYKAEDFYNDVKKITNQEPIRTIKDAEPIGPKNFLDLIIIAPYREHPCQVKQRNHRHPSPYGGQSPFEKQ